MSTLAVILVSVFFVFEKKSELGMFSEGVMSGHRLPLGTRVVRGPDWQWGNQDSGLPGTVVQHEDKTSQ